MRLQPRDTACEDIKDVEGMVIERIKAWSTNNGGTLPKNILYYRDGVSDTVSAISVTPQMILTSYSNILKSKNTNCHKSATALPQLRKY